MLTPKWKGVRNLSGIIVMICIVICFVLGVIRRYEWACHKLSRTRRMRTRPPPSMVAVIDFCKVATVDQMPFPKNTYVRFQLTVKRIVNTTAQRGEML